MRWYNDLADRVSRSALSWILCVFTFSGSLVFVFFNLAIPFEKIVGAPMFDFQNGLTVAQIFAQLPGYDEAARAIYHAFLFVDFYFPFFAGLTLAATAAFAWRYLAPRFYERVTERNLLALFLVPTLFDWSENTWAIVVVGSYPDEATWAASLLVWSKMGKLATMMLANTVVALSLVAAGGKWLLDRVR